MQHSNPSVGNSDLLQLFLAEEFRRLRFFEELLQEALATHRAYDTAIICSKISEIIEELRALLHQLPADEILANELAIGSIETNVARICAVELDNIRG